MTERKNRSRSCDKQERQENPRREFLGKAAILVAGLAVFPSAGARELIGQDKTRQLTRQALFMLADGKVYTGEGLMDHLGFDSENLRKGCENLCIIKIDCGKLGIKPLALRSGDVMVGKGRTQKLDNCAPYECSDFYYPSSTVVIDKLKKQGLIGTKEELTRIRRVN